LRKIRVEPGLEKNQRRGRKKKNITAKSVGRRYLRMNTKLTKGNAGTTK